MKTQSAAGTEWITAGVSQSWCKVRRVGRRDLKGRGGEALWKWDRGRSEWSGKGKWGGEGKGINSLEGCQWC